MIELITDVEEEKNKCEREYTITSQVTTHPKYKRKMS
jgi:hypothetical protein